MYGNIYNQTEGHQIAESGNPFSVIPEYSAKIAHYGAAISILGGGVRVGHHLARPRLEELANEWSAIGKDDAGFLNTIKRTTGSQYKKIFMDDTRSIGRRIAANTWKDVRAAGHDIFHFHGGVISNSIITKFSKHYVKNGGNVKSFWGRRYAKLADEALESRAVVFGPGIEPFFAAIMSKGEMESEGKTFGAYVGLGSAAGGIIGTRVGALAGKAVGATFGGTAGMYIGSAIGMLTGGMLGMEVAPTLYKMAQSMRAWGSPETGGTFMDNRMTMTMRQRSMLAIRTSQMNLRSELGREAQVLMGAQF